jgi:hypothetical protein
VTPSIDLFLYIAAAVLFTFAGFDVHFGKPEPWSLRWDALAFCALTLSLIF